MNTGKLWRKRCATFWIDVAPYVRYMLSGGFGVMLILIAVVGGLFYARLLEQVTDQFPGALIAAILFFFIFIWSSIRTFLREPDIVWLLPEQSEMAPYLRAAWQYSFVLQTISLGVVWLLYWPIYRLSETAASSTFIVIFIFLIVLKIVNLHARWQSLQMRETRISRVYEGIRLCVNALVLYVAFAYMNGKAFLFVLFVLLTFIVALRIPHRLSLHWERFIEMERRHRSKIYTFIGWFVDVEEMPSTVKRRRYLDPFVRRIPYRRESAYTYLYSITWLRSELAAIVMRLLVAAGIIVIFSSILWVKSVAFLIAQLVIGVQLSSLVRLHQHSMWLHLYPLPEQGRMEAVSRLNRKIHFILFVALSVVMLLTAGWSLYVILTIGVGLAMLFTFHRLRRLTH